MKFILDVGLGKKVDSYLITKEYDIICIRDIDPRMSDEKILDLAVQKKCVVITMDKDFVYIKMEH